MAVRFLHITGEALTFTPGLPGRYSGPVLNGAAACHTRAAFGDIVLQEMNTEYISLSRLHIHWKKPEKIVCQYNYPPGVFTRTVLDNNLHEYIKGAGEIHLKKEQFATLAGSKWTGVLLAEKPGDHNVVDIALAAELLQDVLAVDDKCNEAIQHIYYGLPERLTGAPNRVNIHMSRILADLHDIDFSSAAVKDVLHQQIIKYVRWVLKEIENGDSVRRDIKEADWRSICEAKELIDTNPDKHFTIPEISIQTGMNEFKLKQLFPKVTGFKIDEYRKYQLCIKAGKKIVQMPDEPLKNFFEEAGYTSLTTFIRGFRKLCCCTPGELREEGWDISGLWKNAHAAPINFIQP